MSVGLGAHVIGDVLHAAFGLTTTRGYAFRVAGLIRSLEGVPEEDIIAAVESMLRETMRVVGAFDAISNVDEVCRRAAADIAHRTRGYL